MHLKNDSSDSMNRLMNSNYDECLCTKNSIKEFRVIYVRKASNKKTRLNLSLNYI
jgi:hypothetical protein